MAEWETFFMERYELSFLSTCCEVWKYNYWCLHRRKWKHRAILCEAGLCEAEPAEVWMRNISTRCPSQALGNGLACSAGLAVLVGKWRRR